MMEIHTHSSEWRCPLPRGSVVEFCLNQSDQRQIPIGETKENTGIPPRIPAERFPRGVGDGEQTWEVTDYMSVDCLTVHDILQAGSMLFIFLSLGHHKSGFSLYTLLEVRGQVSHMPYRGFLQYLAQLVFL